MTNNEKYEALLVLLNKQPFLNNGTRELMNYCDAWDPYERLNRCKESYHQHEMDWYLSHDLCIKKHVGIENNPVWKKCATKHGNVNSNYGWCVFSMDNYQQFENAVVELKTDSHSRRSCCIYNRPSMQIDYHDNIHAASDFMCTYATQHLIRNNKLEYTVMMRSNDVDTGLPYDLAWHQYVYNKMYQELLKPYPDLQVGLIHWFAVSMHRYERNI